jgi:hypothetical protein
MSPRDAFWFLAGGFVAVAILATVRAWPRARPASAGSPAGYPLVRSFAVPVAAALALIGVALGIYFLFGSPEPQPAVQAEASRPSATAGSLDEVTTALARRLAMQGGSDNDWKLLARSYEYMGRSAEAKAAEAHIASASPMAAGVNASFPDSAQSLTGGQMADVADALERPAMQHTNNGAERAN